MILVKTWERFAGDRSAPGGIDGSKQYLDVYTGWFLFGILPVFISRDRKRR